MSDLSKIVYLSAAQYETLKTNGTITVGGTTINYSNDDLYLTPDTTVPSGGTTGQVLTKASNSDYDTVWASPTEYAEKDASNLSSANITSWQSVLGVKPITLWTNLSPNAQMGETTITLSDNYANYSFIVIIFSDYYAGNTMLPQLTIPNGITDGYTCALTDAACYRRNIHLQNSNQILFNQTTKFNFNGGYVSENEHVIPQYVYGIK